jgi:hypothetical protein
MSTPACPSTTRGPLDEWRDMQGLRFTAALAAMTSLVLFLSALGIFSLLSVSVSRRTREIGLRVRVALGGGVLLLLIALWEEDVARFAGL